MAATSQMAASFAEGDGDPQEDGFIYGESVVSAARVLHDGVSPAVDDGGRNHPESQAAEP